ncbi:MAG: hypothetical protein ACKO1U_10860 [Bacteroidota bacterium]
MEIAGLADTTVVVVVPEAGDEIQTMKSGIMEIADIFVVNKADREGADSLAHTLRQLTAHPRNDGWQVPVLKTSASNLEGIEEVLVALDSHKGHVAAHERRVHLLAEKAYRLIRQHRMAGVQRDQLVEELKKAAIDPNFNLYRFVASKA